MNPAILAVSLLAACGAGLLLAVLLPFRKRSLVLSALLATGCATGAWLLVPLLAGPAPPVAKAAVAAAAFCGVALAGYPPGLKL